MQVRLVFGPAGTGKTHRCLGEIRQALRASAEGPPLLLIAPKQSTYHLERQLLADPATPGYTRLHILSFERLAWFVLTRLRRAAPDLLDEEGRLMVLRGLLARERDHLALFRASARLTGFARQLSEALREFQAQQITPARLRDLASRGGGKDILAAKLQDLAHMLQRYQEWLVERGLHDVDSLLDAAARAATDPGGLRIERLWVDGFTEFTGQELQLLASLLPGCGEATLTFCLDALPGPGSSWISGWSAASRSFLAAERALQAAPGVTVVREQLAWAPETDDRPAPLRHLERCWHEPQPFAPSAATPPLDHSVRWVPCRNPEAEVTLAAREILRFVRRGARFREAAVLVRDFQDYVEPIQRVFARYDLPFFMDRRESVAHHPAAELTRSALRTVAFDWRAPDWFSALKTGLARVAEGDVDLLENEALARGWQGAAWRAPLVVIESPDLARTLIAIQERVMPPFVGLREAIGRTRSQPSGEQLAAAIRQFWHDLAVSEQLEHWATDPAADPDSRLPAAVHPTVWQQLNAWLENLELAFGAERLPVREWLPILEAGLANLTVGLIPPALDQVLVGTIDRSRDVGARLVAILGMNEGRFPAPPKRGILLTETDRAVLEAQGALQGSSARYQLSHERFLAYIGFTRARQHLLLTTAREDAAGTPLNPSSYLAAFTALFPGLAPLSPEAPTGWRQAQHACELLQPVLEGIAHQTASGSHYPLQELARHPRLHAAAHQWASALEAGREQASIGRDLAARLFGPVLRTSVSRLEQFAACPFKYFVSAGLRAEERRLFELDAKERGSFLHDVLAEFHQELEREHLRWRDLTPADARERVARIATQRAGLYRGGLLHATEQTRFQARILISSLQDFVETAVGWMRTQYAFDPRLVELGFGEAGTPEWTVPLSAGRQLKLYGRIDRVDLCPDSAHGATWCVVVDYKSGQKQLDPILIANGLQLQLLTYLNVLAHAPDWCRHNLGGPLRPAGVFYVNLRGRYVSGANREEALEAPGDARRRAYQHAGRFDVAALPWLDGRPGATQGDQFRYKLKKDGSLARTSPDPLSTEAFNHLLDSTETILREMGDAICGGDVRVAPFRLRSMTACDHCDYASVCRMDPWAQSYRNLRAAAEPETDPGEET